MNTTMNLNRRIVSSDAGETDNPAALAFGVRKR
jgi:hypothetical protein